jgi:hypothetical protein
VVVDPGDDLDVGAVAQGGVGEVGLKRPGFRAVLIRAAPRW